METITFLPIILVVVCAILIYAMLEFITCCLLPGWAEKLGCKRKAATQKRSRFLSIYDIYNPADNRNDVRRFETLFAVAKAKAASDITKIEEGQEATEGQENDQPPSYDQVVRVLDNDNPNPNLNTIIV